MKLLPLIGALLLSAAPVQASKTFELIIKPCGSSEEVFEACHGMGVFYSTLDLFDVLCVLREGGEITPKIFEKAEKFHREMYVKVYQIKSYNKGIEAVLKRHPNCPVKVRSIGQE